MLVIVIILSAVVFTATSNLINLGASEQPPRVVADDQFFAEQNTMTGNVYYKMDLTHQFGEEVDRDEIEVLVRAGDEERRFDVGSGKWGVGDKIRVNISKVNVCSGGADEAHISVIHKPTQSQIYATDADIRRNVNLSIEGNSVGTDVPYRAEVTVLGAGASAESGGTIQPDSLVARTVILNEDGTVNETLTPFGSGPATDSITFTPNGLPTEGDNLNDPDDRAGDDSIRESYTTDVLQPGQTVTLEARSVKPNGWDAGSSSTIQVTREGTTYDYAPIDRSQGAQDTRYWVDARNPSASEVEVFNASNADAVDINKLDNTGLPWQKKASDIMAPYISGNNLQLDDNQAIFLFELNTQNADYDAGNGDFNDMIALIEVEPEPDVVQSKSKPVIQCG